MEEGKPLIFLHPLTKSVQALKENIEKTAEKDGIEIYDVENPEEYNQLIPTIGQSLTIACQPKKCAQCIQPLKKIIAKNNVKILLINEKNIPPKTLEKFRKIGLTEYIQEPVPPKTLLYKINLILRSLKKQQVDDEMEYHAKEEKQTFSDGDDYEDKGEAQNLGNAGHLKGKVNKNKSLKDDKDVFDDSSDTGSDFEETQEDQFKNLKEMQAEQAIDSTTSGRLQGDIQSEEANKKKKDIQFDDDLYEQNTPEKNTTNSSDQLGGNLQGKIKSKQEDIKDEDEFDEDLFKNLESIRNSSYKEESQGGALKGDVSPTLDGPDKENKEEDLFASLDALTNKRAQEGKDQGGHYKGDAAASLDDLQKEEKEEDLFASLDALTNKNGQGEKDQGGHYKGDTSPTLDDIEEEKNDEDLFASLDAITNKRTQKAQDQGGHYKGETPPSLDDIEDEKQEEDLFAALNATKESSQNKKDKDIGGHYKNDSAPSLDETKEDNTKEDDLLSSLDVITNEKAKKDPVSQDHDNDLIDNEKGLKRGLAENEKARTRDEDLFDSLKQHSEQKPRQNQEQARKNSEQDDETEENDETSAGGTIQYERKGDLGEQTIDYQNLDKLPEYTGGTKKKLNINISDANADEIDMGAKSDNSTKEDDSTDDLFGDLNKEQKEESAGYDYSKRPLNEQATSAQDHQLKVNQYTTSDPANLNSKLNNSESETDASSVSESQEDAKDQEELDEAINSIIIPDSKDMDFFIRVTNKVIDGDEIKKIVADYINGFCRGTLIVYNLQNECIMGSEEGPDNFSSVKNILKVKRTPSWNDPSFRSEDLYYHCPIIENTNYNYFIVFFTTKDEVANNEEIPKRIEICIEALRGNYKSGEDRITTKVSASKSLGSNIKDSVYGLFKGLFGKGRT